MDNKKEQKLYDFLFLDAEAVFDSLKKFFINEMRKARRKEKECESIWKFINNYKVKDSFSEEFKITLAIIFTIVFSIWIGNHNLIYAVRSDQESEIDFLKPDGKAGASLAENANGISTDPDKYRFKSGEDFCNEDKEKKTSSDLCGKDDEEIVSKIEKEEMAKRIKTEKRAVVKISAKVPYAFVVAGGKRVCNKKNDHPSKSDKNKGKHMDMECCLDPDEIPNPHCYYNPAKYGKYM
jgi:hypothetical protein